MAILASSTQNKRFSYTYISTTTSPIDMIQISTLKTSLFLTPISQQPLVQLI
ncbi:hypothetical protein K443DRAFT_13487 [Laccaria amethystina LaAM-08-1]|uniref:Uncharacterized protein n=1 Tax=Laccaria amethystina LaAM-08-1 TaxID=1095629 RepID=A0A0C9WVB0_9AGAR|nr:hypothetical protein K443DRAFT_13487 [Laccaria amethystina LaAM-08-1]